MQRTARKMVIPPSSQQPYHEQNKALGKEALQDPVSSTLQYRLLEEKRSRLDALIVAKQLASYIPTPKRYGKLVTKTPLDTQ